MAISVANSSSATQGVSVSSVISSPTFTSTTGNLLIAAAFSAGATGEGATPFSDSLNTWTSQMSSVGASAHQFADIAYAKNITGKTGEAVTFTINTGAFPDVCLLEVAGCDPTSPLSVAATYAAQAGGSTSTTPLITPAAGNYILVMVGGNDAGGTQSIANAAGATGTPVWTVIKNDGASGEPFLVAYTIVTVNGTDTYGLTYSNTGGGPIIAGIAAFTAAGGTVVELDHLLLLGCT